MNWFRLYSLLMMLLLLAAPLLHAASSATGPHIRVSLISENQTLVPGEKNWIGMLFQPEQGWHTYWQNPGDSGEPPKVTWKTANNINIGQWQWPIPTAIPVAHLVNYGYEGDSLLMAPVSLPSDASGPVVIQAELSWLVCQEDCIPGWATLEITIPTASSSSPGEFADLFEQTRKQLPHSTPITANHEVAEQHLTVRFSPPYQSQWQLLPLRSDTSQHNQLQQSLQIDHAQLQTLVLSDYFDPQQQSLAFLLTDGTQGYYLSSTSNQAASGPTDSLWLLMLMAFAGGLILNLMPCVLPVLSIKALSFQQQDSSVSSKLGFPLGVLVSFNLFAIAIAVLKQGGEAVGWGFHMQHPWVIALLAFLFLFIALQLMEIAPRGNRLMGIGQPLTDGNTFRSQFFSGVLAVVVASPCSAPFMATAMGVALVSSLQISFVLFTSLAIGFALPMTLLFWLPALIRLLPKPGPWMARFRQFLVFPMLATVLWLLWVYQQQTSPQAQLLLLTSMLLFSLLIWVSGLHVKRLSGLTTVLALLSPLIVLQPAGNISQAVQTEPSLSFSEQQLQQLREQQQVVLINLTADWCITCKVNEQVAFRSTAVRSLLNQQDVHYLVGDWTNKNQSILQFLNRYQRSGVPLYVVYAGTDYEQVLPQLLTPQTVIEAINRAKREINHDS